MMLPAMMLEHGGAAVDAYGAVIVDAYLAVIVCAIEVAKGAVLPVVVVALYGNLRSFAADQIPHYLK
jgi:hypothetical protein